jgi:hypothetical protein
MRRCLAATWNGNGLTCSRFLKLRLRLAGFPFMHTGAEVEVDGEAVVVLVVPYEPEGGLRGGGGAGLGGVLVLSGLSELVEVVVLGGALEPGGVALFVGGVGGFELIGATGDEVPLLVYTCGSLEPTGG